MKSGDVWFWTCFGLAWAFIFAISHACDAHFRGGPGEKCYPNQTCDSKLVCVPGRVVGERQICAKETP